jgi:transcription elongation factor Elf1
MKDRYNFTCPNCKYEQSAAPSLFMNMGHNRGCGDCFNCDVLLHLEIIPDLNGNKMKATLWGEYLDEKTIEVKT